MASREQISVEVRVRLRKSSDKTSRGMREMVAQRDKPYSKATRTWPSYVNHASGLQLISWV